MKQKEVKKQNKKKIKYGKMVLCFFLLITYSIYSIYCTSKLVKNT